LDIKGIWQI